MWVSSAEFAAKFEIEYEALKKSCVRASKIGKKFCKFKCNLLLFSYFNGIGRGGKVLKIWDTPFKSEGEAECFLAEYAKEMAENGGVEHGGQRTENGTQSADNGTQRVDTSALPHCENKVVNGKATTLTTFLPRATHSQRDYATRTTLRNLGHLNAENRIQNAENGLQRVDTSALPQYDNVNALPQRNNNGKSHDLTHPQTAGATQWGFLPHNEGANPTKKATNAKAQNIALEKMSIVKEWERAKTKMNAKDFIALTNAKGDYSINISENKLYAWQKAFKAGGFDALVDSRGGSKASSIESLGLSQIVTKLIMASRGRVNISSMHRLLHAHLAMSGLCDMKAFLGKESEYVSYGVLERFVKNYLKANPLQKIIIQKGEDGAVSRFLPALGVSNYKANSINEVVEIDATSIDAIIDTSALAHSLGVEIESIEAWQKRFVLISLVDTYSGVCSFHISDTENSLGVSRAIAKYIMNYGKPKLIKSDNGSAFVSKYIKEVLLRLDIESERTPAYSGWCKPYVERNFARLQNHLMEWLKGYIGHSVAQRQAIEFFFSRAQRRLKRGQKSNQRDLHTLNELAHFIDNYTQSFMNNAYLQRLEKTPTEAYNERANEAVAMNEYELMSRLSPLERRAVGKKGIAYGGLYFYSTKIYKFNSVLVAANINDNSQLFVYDEKGAFVDIANALDNEKGVSAEEAKRAQKHFKKKLKEEKAKMSEARAWVESATPEIYAALAKNMPKTTKPKYKPLNDKLLESAKAREEASKKVVGMDFVEKVSAEKSKVVSGKATTFTTFLPRATHSQRDYATRTTLRKNGALKGVGENTLPQKKNLSWESAVLGGEK